MSIPETRGLFDFDGSMMLISISRPHADTPAYIAKPLISG